MTINRLKSGLSVASALSFVSLPAFAHGGHHGEFGLLSALEHVVRSPFHMVLAGLAVGFAVVMLQIISRLRRII